MSCQQSLIDLTNPLIIWMFADYSCTIYESNQIEPLSLQVMLCTHIVPKAISPHFGAFQSRENGFCGAVDILKPVRSKDLDGSGEDWRAIRAGRSFLGWHGLSLLDSRALTE